MHFIDCNMGKEGEACDCSERRQQRAADGLGRALATATTEAERRRERVATARDGEPPFNLGRGHTCFRRTLSDAFWCKGDCALPETVPCRVCGTATDATAIKICASCWEVERRLDRYLSSPVGRETVARKLGEANMRRWLADAGERPALHGEDAAIAGLHEAADAARELDRSRLLLTLKIAKGEIEGLLKDPVIASRVNEDDTAKSVRQTLDALAEEIRDFERFEPRTHAPDEESYIEKFERENPGGMARAAAEEDAEDRAERELWDVTLADGLDDPAAAEEEKDECVSCGEGMPGGECSKSKRSCSHHCNHSWSSATCCWCGETIEDEESAEAGDDPAAAETAAEPNRLNPYSREVDVSPAVREMLTRDGGMAKPTKCPGCRHLHDADGRCRKKYSAGPSGTFPCRCEIVSAP